MQPYASLYLNFKSFFSVRVLVGLAMSALVNGIISELGSLLQSELGLLWSFKDDLEDMKTTLVSVQAVLHDAEKRSFSDEIVRLWLKRLKVAAYDIEDMLDKFQIQKHSKFQVLKSYNVKSCFSIPVMAHKLKGMKKNLDKIAEERKNYSLREEAITHQEQVIKGRETCSSMTRADVLGREEEATEIINRLLMSTTEDICIIPIVGIGGLGKTTLAKLIYNDDRIKEAFELRIWVHAVDFQVEKLVEEILLSSRSGNRNNLGNLEAQVQRVKEILNGRRYLIVLDDVWNEDWKKWDDFKQVLHGGKRESRIIVTTRSEGVGLTMRAEMPHKLKPLSDDVCLELFERKAFVSAGAKDNNLASIGKEIVKKCQGVPLTANSLGGMLFGKGEATWENIKDSDLWKVVEGEGSSSENNIIFSLNLSYQLMPYALKLCFVYCSSYPKAFKLDKDMLIQQWIAQRFIQTKDEIQAVQIGDRYVNYLLSISFLEKEEEEEEETYMKMHDLVYDLARWVAGDEVSDALESGKYNAMECCYASVINYNEASKELLKALPRKVRALHFQKFTSSLPKGIFSYTKCLRVLDFSSCSLHELPTSIYRLKQLRYLGLPDHLKEVDERIRKLGTLESLIISGCTAIHILPTSIGKLYNLIYLEINDCHSLSKIPNSIGSLQRLNSLKLAYCLDLTSLPESLGDLVNLVTLDINNCPIVLIPNSIGSLQRLNSLKLAYCLHLTSLPESLGDLVNLVTLDINNCSIITLPASIGKLYNLIYLEINDCDSLSKIPNSIGRLQRLNSLKLASCPIFTSLPESLGDLVNLVTLGINNCFNITLPASIGKLHNLIDLDLSFSSKLLELPHSIGELKKLNSLKLYRCYKLGSLPDSLGNLMELRTLDIQGCAMLDLDELHKAICNMRNLKLQRDEPLELLEFGTSELELHLIDGYRGGYVVRHVSDAKRINLKERGGSIKSLSYHCGGNNKGRAVEAMLEALQPHQNLQELCIDDYEGSMFPSWMMSQMESFLPNLVKITLKGISNCEHLPVLGQLPKLEEILIVFMEKVRRISEEELCGARNTTAGASFPSLKRLELGHMDELEEWVTAAMAGDDGERGASLFPCLEHLSIHACPDLRKIYPCIPPSVRRLSLYNNLHVLTFLDVPEMPLLKHLHIYDYGLDIFPESIRRLTSLETLKLMGCKSLTTFPEWLGELSQLQHLVLEDCRLIDRLPQSIQCLTALKRLRIMGCSKSLSERTRKETGEDWDKISHIDNIQIYKDYDSDSSED